MRVDCRILAGNIEAVSSWNIVCRFVGCGGEVKMAAEARGWSGACGLDLCLQTGIAASIGSVAVMDFRTSNK